MTFKKPWDHLPAAKPAHALWAAVAACALMGLGIARLTLRLNPHLAERFLDTFFVHFWLTAGYGALGILPGLLGAAVLAAGRRLPRAAWRRTLGTVIVGGLALAPLVYFLLLPDVGLGPGVLTRVLTAAGLGRVFSLAQIALAVAGLGLLVGYGLARAARRLDVGVDLLAGALGGLGVVVLFAAVGPDAAPDPLDGAPQAELPDLARDSAGPEPPRVVLLCIDGADLDDVILPMIEDGDLPGFARLIREGTWGPLETFEPTLSPVIWTSLITGKEPAAHGVHHFLHFRLPGVRQAIYHFPLHTGLNFRVFPVLEKIPGMPVLRTPYTSNMRRAEALWNIVGRRYPVGAYRWLISWPAEEVNGFSVSGSVGWVDFSDEMRREVSKNLAGRRTHPRQLQRLQAERPRREIAPQEIAAYVGAGFEIDRRDPRLQPILSSLDDPTSEELPALIERFGVRFAAAGFYTVDPFHHLFNRHRLQGGIFAGAIAERYRFTDARLAELIEALGDDTHVLVVSDHGFDFENNHHTLAPPGIFFARGPAFEAGRRVDSLSVYDVAPMVLHLLDMPLPDDMPGARTENYRSALQREFLAARPVRRIATYENLRGGGDHESLESPQDDAIRDVLKTLGYVH